MAYILVVDDDEDFAAAVAAVLSSAGHEVAMEHSPQSALIKIEERRPDAILLDVMFPENAGAGFELAGIIRQLHAETPILMLTGVNQKFPLGFGNRDLELDKIPVAGFLEKPIDFDLLCRRVEELLQAPRG